MDSTISDFLLDPKEFCAFTLKLYFVFDVRLAISTEEEPLMLPTNPSSVSEDHETL